MIVNTIAVSHGLGGDAVALEHDFSCACDTEWVLPCQLAYGGDYSPEQWPRDVWDEDVELMQRAGVNLVSVGIFSWPLLEPTEGTFDFAWMDDLFELLHFHGIAVDLATPTASPPAWFFQKYPHARAVTRDGVPLGFGSRGIVSPSSPEYKAAAVRIATELAKRYGTHPAVKMWHVHNEYGAPVSDEYSDNAMSAFRAWLMKRYTTLDALNTAWGTRFWGQYYHAWDQVGAPRLTPAVVNPAQRLDFQRFSDWALRECFIAERDAIRQHASQPVTTNFMANQTWSTDLWEWAKEVDVVADDHYLWAADPESHIGLAIAADLTRSLAHGQPWMVLEHSTSAVNWQPRNLAKRPGEMRRNSLVHLGRGADAVMFFQWRASRSGAEKFHSAMLPHSGTTSRVWREVVELGDDLRRLEPIQGSVVAAEVAMLWDFESHWAMSGEGHPSIDVTFPEQIRRYYEPLWRDNVTVDFVHPGADLSKYKLVVAPSQYMLSTEEAENLTEYVYAGGSLVVSFYSGVVDRNDAVHASPTRGGGFAYVLEPALGVVVDEFLPMPEGAVGQLQVDGRPAESTLWQEDVRITSATAIGSYTSGPAALLGAQAPAVTMNRHGDGLGYYISTQMDPHSLRNLLRRVYQDAGVTRIEAPEGVEVIVRTHTCGDDGRSQYAVVANHGEITQYLPLSGFDILRGKLTLGGEPIAPGEVAVFRLATRGESPGDPRQTQTLATRPGLASNSKEGK